MKEAKRNPSNKTSRQHYDGNNKFDVHSAREVLINRIERIAQRFRANLGLEQRAASARGATATNTQSNAAAAPHTQTRFKPRSLSSKPLPDQRQPENEPPLLYAGKVNSSQVIPDEEFEPRYRDLTTANWRESIERNEANARRRGGA